MPVEQAVSRGARLRAIAALILTYAYFAILLNSVGTVILQAVATLNVDARGASILEAFKDLPIAIVSFAVAAFLPRFGYRRAMIAGLLMTAIGCALMPLLPGFATTKLLFFLIGSAFALVKTATYSTIGLLTTDAREHAALTNLIEGLFMVGVLAGYWVFAAFIDPVRPASLGWLNVYWLLLAISALVIALLAVSPFDERGAIDPESLGPKDDIKAMVKLLARGAVLVFVAAAFTYVLIEQGVGSWLPTFNAAVLHLPAAMSVQAASLYAAALALGRVGSAPIIRLAGWLPVLLGCVAGILLVVLVVVPMAEGIHPRPGTTWLDAPFATYAMPMIGLFLAPVYPTINSAILSSLPRARHAAMTGLIITFSALGGTTGSFITGHVFAAFGGTTAFRLILVPAIVLGLLLVALKRAMRPARQVAAIG
jgi:fucose permease